MEAYDDGVATTTTLFIFLLIKIYVQRYFQLSYVGQLMFCKDILCFGQLLIIDDTFIIKRQCLGMHQMDI